MNRSQRHLERGRRRLRLVAVVLVGGTPAALVAGCGGRADLGSRSINARATVTTTAAGTVIARATDRDHGLSFELESSPSAQTHSCPWL